MSLLAAGKRKVPKQVVHKAQKTVANHLDVFGSYSVPLLAVKERVSDQYAKYAEYAEYRNLYANFAGKELNDISLS